MKPSNLWHNQASQSMFILLLFSKAIFGKLMKGSKSWETFSMTSFTWMKNKRHLSRQNDECSCLFHCFGRQANLYENLQSINDRTKYFGRRWKNDNVRAWATCWIRVKKIKICRYWNLEKSHIRSKA